MTRLNNISIIGKSIPFYLSFAKLMGSTSGCMVLGLLYYWNETIANEDGWFSKSFEDFHKDIIVTRREWENARKRLVSTGIISCKRDGLNPTFSYRLNIDVLTQ